MKIASLGWGLAATLLLTLASSSNAAFWTEVGDAGDLVGTAQTTVGAGSLDMITGLISATTFTDIYRIRITSAAAFSATTVNAGTPAGNDTQLFLFTTTGIGIAINDDTSATEFRSTLPVGNALYASLAPGEYLLAVSTFDTDPFSAGFADIFPFSPFDGSPTTGIYGPTGAGGGAPLVGWFNDPASTFGPYQINLTGATFAQAAAVVPEPSSLTLLAMGVLGLAGYTRRRWKK